MRVVRAGRARFFRWFFFVDFFFRLVLLLARGVRRGIARWSLSFFSRSSVQGESLGGGREDEKNP